MHYLIKRNVNIVYNTHIDHIEWMNNHDSLVDTHGRIFYADDFVFCTPLKCVHKIVGDMLYFHIPKHIDLDTYVHNSSYIGVGFSFHFASPQKYVPLNGFNTEWHIIVEDKSTHIKSEHFFWSVVVVDTTIRSSVINKCVDEMSNLYEIANEIARQLDVVPNVIVPDPNLKYSKRFKHWTTIHSSYSNRYGPMKTHNPILPNLYIVGPHTQNEPARIDTTIASQKFLFQIYITYDKHTNILICFLVFLYYQH